MRNYRTLLIYFVLLIFMIGAVSASHDNETTVGTSFVDVTPVDSAYQPVVGVGDNNIKDIYVNDTGDDSNVGSALSPYATIGKAVGDINTSDIATIHLSEGIFESDEDVNFDMSRFQQTVDGGSLTFIGAGTDKTIIDGQDYFKFATLGYYTNITFRDITFTNFRGSYGGIIESYGGILTVENCIFKDSYAVGDNGGAISMKNNGGTLTVKDSQFISCAIKGEDLYNLQRGGGAIFAYDLGQVTLVNNVFIGTTSGSNPGAALWSNSKTYLDGNKFINLTGTYDASIYLSNDNCTVVNNEFINCTNPSTTYSIVYIYSGILKNNTFINSSNRVGNIYSQGILPQLNISMIDEVIDIGNVRINKGIDISVDFKDDMGNIVRVPSFRVNFNSEDKNYTYTPFNYHINFDPIPEIGVYNISIIYGGMTFDVLTTANIHYSSGHGELYVSPEGDDAAKGTIDAPFATIQHALDVGFDNSFDVVIHLMNGTYFGDGNVELDISYKGTLQIIGEEYNKTIIDGIGENWFLKVNTKTTIKNLNFVNGYSKDNMISSEDNNLYLENCILDNNVAKYCGLWGVSFYNLTYTNNQGNIYYTSSNAISDSYFANNRAQIGAGAIDTELLMDIEVTNCKFINNSGFQGGAINTEGLTCTDCYFEGNYADDGGAIHAANCYFKNTDFINNRAINNGVITLPDTYSVKISVVFEKCNFINNSAENAGVTTLRLGNFINCSFINNSADYGGVFILLPYYIKEQNSFIISNENSILGKQQTFMVNSHDNSEKIGKWESTTTFELTDVVFDENVARINGNDIFIGEGYEKNQYIQDPSFKINFKYLIDLSVSFNDKNVTKFIDNLTANVHGPLNSVVGGGNVNFIFDGVDIGYSEIVNGVATIKYVGFENGEYNLTGDIVTVLPVLSKDAVDGVISVNLEDTVGNIEFWISPKGSDENGDGNKASPFKSISHAISESTKQYPNIVIHLDEGIYTGDLNTALEISSKFNIKMIGAGIKKTIIDGENINNFATITTGINKIEISNLTIQNMLPDNRKSREFSSISPIKVEGSGSLYLDNVYITNNHGGNAIIKNEGNVFINNSVITKNGLFYISIISGGKVNIDNSLIYDNFGTSGAIACGFSIINNSVIKNNFNLGLSDVECKSCFYLIGGKCIIENTEISNDGDNSSLNLIGINDEDSSLYPAISFYGRSITLNNVSMINNFNSEGTSFNWYNDYDLPIFNWRWIGSNDGEKNITAYNSSFFNFKQIWWVNSWLDLKFEFQSCLFKNFTRISQTKAVGENSSWVFNNSVFLDVGMSFERPNYFTNPTPPVEIQHNTGCNTIPYDNNYWGSNSKPIISYVDGNETIFRCVPKSWIILTSDDNKTISVNTTNGRKLGTYTGDIPISGEYTDRNGTLEYVVAFGDVGYSFSVDNNKNIVLNESDFIYPFVAVNPMDYKISSEITILGLQDYLLVKCILLDCNGNPIGNASLSYDIDGLNPVNVTTDEEGSFVVKGDREGILNIVFAGDETYVGAEYKLRFTNAGKTAKSFININGVEGSLITGVLVDDEGNPIGNASLSYDIDGLNLVNVTTDEEGSFVVKGDREGILNIVFAGDETYVGAEYKLRFTNAGKTAKSFINVNGVEGSLITGVLVDDEGNPIANAIISYDINGNNAANTTTDANGTFKIQGESNSVVNIIFAGTEKVNAVNTTVTLKDLTHLRTASVIKAEDYTTDAIDFYAGERGGFFKIQLLDEKGNALANKPVKIGFNGVVYDSTTNETGWAKLQINLAYVGEYTFAVAFLGDDDYNASFVVQKIIVNKKKTGIEASTKSFKANSKTKSYTVTLKTDKGSSFDGKAYLKAGKKVTVIVNGKTYTAKTNSNGQATFKLIMTKKGKYSATVKFDGDGSYAASSKSAKITIK